MISPEWTGFNWFLSQCTICNQHPVIKQAVAIQEYFLKTVKLFALNDPLDGD